MQYDDTKFSMLCNGSAEAYRSVLWNIQEYFKAWKQTESRYNPLAKKHSNFTTAVWVKTMLSLQRAHKNPSWRISLWLPFIVPISSREQFGTVGHNIRTGVCTAYGADSTQHQTVPVVTVFFSARKSQQKYTLKMRNASFTWGCKTVIGLTSQPLNTYLFFFFNFLGDKWEVHIKHFCCMWSSQGRHLELFELWAKLVPVFTE